MKGQASLEFMMMVIVVLFFIMAFYVYALGKENVALETEKQKNIESMCSDIANKIDSVFFYGSGFKESVYLPEKVYGLDYKINVYNKTLICSAGKYSFIEKFVSEKITNSTHYPPFQIPNRKITIKNYLGEVRIS